jgi:ribonuclease P protein component
LLLEEQKVEKDYLPNISFPIIKVVKVGNILGRLRNKREFQEVTSNKKKIVTQSFVIYCKNNILNKNCNINIGFTVSGKIGNAVVRNKAKRRLKSAANHIIPTEGIPGTNYVIIAKNQINRISFESLENDLIYAIKKLSKSRAN